MEAMARLRKACFKGVPRSVFVAEELYVKKLCYR